MANIGYQSFTAEPYSVSELSSVEKANQHCDILCAALNKHTTPSLRKEINHNYSPWFESIRDEPYKQREQDIKQRENGGT